MMDIVGKKLVSFIVPDTEFPLEKPRVKKKFHRVSKNLHVRLVGVKEKQGTEGCAVMSVKSSICSAGG
jgi:hypothetical protein